jgi:superfamily II DNA helicase RecQ
MGSKEVETLWRKPKVTGRLLNFIFDEGHCISHWGKFREEYRHVGLLRYLIPETIPFYAASATFPPSVLRDVSEVLHLRTGKTDRIIRSNDRPEIGLMARGLVFPAKGFRDLAFLIPDDFKEGDPRPPKFLIFFDNTKEAERATRYLRRRLPLSLQENIKYFHSTMTPHYREDELDALRDSRTWGLCATDAFGMVCDFQHSNALHFDQYSN